MNEWILNNNNNIFFIFQTDIALVWFTNTLRMDGNKSLQVLNLSVWQICKKPIVPWIWFNKRYSLVNEGLVSPKWGYGSGTKFLSAPLLRDSHTNIDINNDVSMKNGDSRPCILGACKARGCGDKRTTSSLVHTEDILLV